MNFDLKFTIFDTFRLQKPKNLNILIWITKLLTKFCPYLHSFMNFDLKTNIFGKFCPETTNFGKNLHLLALFYEFWHKNQHFWHISTSKTIKCYTFWPEKPKFSTNLDTFIGAGISSEMNFDWSNHGPLNLSFRHSVTELDFAVYKWNDCLFQNFFCSLPSNGNIIWVNRSTSMKCQLSPKTNAFKAQLFQRGERKKKKIQLMICDSER